MSVSNWKAYSKNTLQGFFTLTLSSGLVIHNCSFHQKENSRWIGLPSQKYTKDDGTVSFTPLIEFTSKEVRYKFQAAALAAVDEFLGGVE